MLRKAITQLIAAVGLCFCAFSANSVGTDLEFTYDFDTRQLNPWATTYKTGEPGSESMCLYYDYDYESGLDVPICFLYIVWEHDVRVAAWVHPPNNLNHVHWSQQQTSAWSAVVTTHIDFPEGGIVPLHGNWHVSTNHSYIVKWSGCEYVLGTGNFYYCSPIQDDVNVFAWGEVYHCAGDPAHMVREYLPEAQGGVYAGGVQTQAGVAFRPVCTDFVNDHPGTTNFDWNELIYGEHGNDHEPWGMIHADLWTGLEATRTNYNRGAILVSSGYRCPEGNADPPVSGANSSRHMFADAADLYSVDHAWTAAEWTLLRDAAVTAGAGYTTPTFTCYADRHLHADWR